MIHHVHILQNFGCIIEDIKDPETGELAGRKIILVDNDAGDVYEYPLNLESAQMIGQKLMGIGAVELSNNGHMHQVIQEASRRRTGGKG